MPNIYNDVRHFRLMMPKHCQWMIVQLDRQKIKLPASAVLYCSTGSKSSVMITTFDLFTLASHVWNNRGSLLEWYFADVRTVKRTWFPSSSKGVNSRTFSKHSACFFQRRAFSISASRGPGVNLHALWKKESACYFGTCEEFIFGFWDLISVHKFLC